MAQSVSVEVWLLMQPTWLAVGQSDWRFVDGRTREAWHMDALKNRVSPVAQFTVVDRVRGLLYGPDLRTESVEVWL